MAIEIEPPCGQILEKMNPETKSSNKASEAKMATSVMNNVLFFIISLPSPKMKSVQEFPPFQILHKQKSNTGAVMDAQYCLYPKPHPYASANYQVHRV
jgi:hypothetical protein